MGGIAPGVPLEDAKMHFFLLRIQHRLLATYPAPILTTFEIKDVNQCLHAYTGEKFPNFCEGVLQVPKTAKNGYFQGMFVIGVQL